MSLSRYKDLWLVVGLGVLTLAGANLIAWQLSEGERLSLQELQRQTAHHRKQEEEAEARATAKKGESHTDDDITLAELSTLIQHPNHDIRHTAIKILVHRYASSPYCKKAFGRDYTLLAPAQVEDEQSEEPVLQVQTLVWNYGLDMPIVGETGVPTPGDTERLEDWIGLIEEGHPGFRERMERLDGIEHLMDREGLEPAPSAPVRRPLSQWQRREAVVMESEDDTNPPELVIPREDRSAENGGAADSAVLNDE